MKGANENIIHIHQFTGGSRSYSQGMYSNLVYAAQRQRNSQGEHDGRGLVAAVLLSVMCWAALGFFILG